MKVRFRVFDFKNGIFEVGFSWKLGKNGRRFSESFLGGCEV